ncbi:electron transport complex subunit RsxB [Burkholderia diffusa]|uniref:electron transport complex subunit RsxB n=1 Tax=Burkholderia diffusa TaxID=488732 RepID=UPI001583A503|nr:electron transport complex subunit RsxB [Burkholderia diffusa]
MREIGDNRSLANLSGRARRGREPFGAAAPVVTVTDSKTLADRIEDLLPQTQCTKCGYDGCRPYADAIAAGNANYNQCPPGGAEGIARLASLLGKPVIPLNPVNGTEHPRAVAFIDESLCIGCTLCMQACPVDAIVGAPKQMHTIVESLCTGCDLCVPPCPVDCIAMVPVTDERTGWDAWSQEQADAARERHDRRLARQRREREAAEARAAARRAASAGAPKAAPAAAPPGAPGAAPAEDADAKKRAIIAAALERARKKKEELSERGAGPKNTEGVSAAVQAQIDAAEARRKRLAEQQALHDTEAAAARDEHDDSDDPNNDDRNGPTAPPDKNRP